MSEQTTTPPPAAETAKPEESAEKIASLEKAIQEKEDALAGLKTKLDEKDLQLLDPDYLEYRKQKGAKKEEPKTPEPSKDPVVADLQKRNQDLEERLEQSQRAINDVLAEMELNRTIAQYPDFKDHREDIMTLLKNSKTELTFEQAYKIVKADAAEKAAAANPQGTKPKTPSGSEKPTGSVPLKSLETKEFKSTEEANQATIASLKDKYPDLTETI